MNNKQTCIISCPIDTWSGYGKRSVDFVKSIIKLKDNDWDIKILSQKWGNTPLGYLEDHNETDLISRTISQLTYQPDIWFQITVPSEFQKIGKLFSCGVTAGIETTICDASWIEGINRMDTTLVSSDFSKQVLLNTKFKDNNTNKLLEINKPVEILFEGIDTNIYKKLDTLESSEGIVEMLDSIKEQFCYLFVGHWLQGELGQDRKDVGMLIRTFLQTFANHKVKPALILKTNGANYSIIDRDNILDKINSILKSVSGDLPKVYLLHGEFNDDEMNMLYNHSKIKAMVSFTKGEGFGRPLLEFSVTGKPVIVSNYSGHLDFLKEHSILLAGSLNKIHPSAVVSNLLIPESSWFTVDYDVSKKVLKEVHDDYNKFLGNSKKQSYLSRTEFSLDKMQELLSSILKNKIPEQKEIKLPKLIKIN